MLCRSLLSDEDEQAAAANALPIFPVVEDDNEILHDSKEWVKKGETYAAQLI